MTVVESLLINVVGSFLEIRGRRVLTLDVDYVTS